MDNDFDAKQQVAEIAEKLNTTPLDLQRMILEDQYNSGCLDYEQFVFLDAVIEAEVRIHLINLDIIELKDYLKMRINEECNGSK